MLARGFPAFTVPPDLSGLACQSNHPGEILRAYSKGRAAWQTLSPNPGSTDQTIAIPPFTCKVAPVT